MVSIANSPLHFHALVSVLMRNMANPVHSKYTLSQFVHVEAQNDMDQVCMSKTWLVKLVML